MKFLHRPAHDFEGITRNFEQLETIFTGLNAVRFGTATFTWAGVLTYSDPPVITHGLPSAPVVVLVSVDWANAAAAAYNLNAATFQAQAQTLDGTVPAGATTATLYWLAIG